MLRNYIIIAFRHLTRHKLFSLINIFCLAIGLSFTMLIGMYIWNEYSINQSLRNVGNQYILKSHWKVKDLGLEITSSGPLPKTMKEEYPNLVANYYRYNPVATVLSAGNKHLNGAIAIGDTTLVTMYGFPVLYGNSQKAFQNDNSVVITESVALQFFGRKNALNEVMTMQTTLNGEKQQYQISAVLKDIPKNSVTGLIGIDYNVFVPTIGNHFYQGGDPAQNWNGVFEIGMLELKAGVKPVDLEIPIRQTLKKYTPSSIHENLLIELTPVKDYYLKTNNGAVQQMILTLSVISGLILLMAVFNFININIGTSGYRLKEIGLRKVFGSARTQLIVQYLAESLILTFAAALISIGLYQILLPVFDQLLNTRLNPIWKFNVGQFGLLFLLALSVGLIAGFYPAFILSASNIVKAVKGKLDYSGNGLGLRRVLLVIQFTLAIMIFISALNVSRQVTYFFSKDLGYNKDQLLVISAYPKQWDSAGVKRMVSIKNQLLTMPEVQNATISFEIPERKSVGSVDLLPPGSATIQPKIIPLMFADEDYAATFGLTLKAGRFFRPAHEGFVTAEIVLNESAVKALGLAVETAVGRQITVPSAKTRYTIAGVVKDYHYAGLQEAIGPLSIIQVNEALAFRFLTIKLRTVDLSKAVERIRGKWAQLSPESPFEYFFMDDRVQKLYLSELQLKKATRIATVLNLIIVFMGIFGVVAFTLAKRSREIAVRKVLGANIRNILLLFMKDYAWLILIANFIGWPLAYWATNRWMQNYAYRVGQDLMPYLIVAIFVFASAFLLIALQCFKEAAANPVRSLRSE